MALPNITSKLANAIALVIALVCSQSAQAGWVTIKNDSNKTIVVQETVVVNGQVKRCKPTSLLPGESLREFLPNPTDKRIEIVDSSNPNKPLWSGKLECQKETQTFSISAGAGKFSVDPVSTPPKK
jgi:hypothetical protein